MGNTSSRCSYCGNDLRGSNLTYAKGVIIKARFCCKECMHAWMAKNV